MKEGMKLDALRSERRSKDARSEPRPSGSGSGKIVIPALDRSLTVADRFRKRRVVTGSTILVTVSLLAVAGFAWAGIEGSKHDFSNSAWSAGDQCSACHSPHREKPPTAAPLWNPEADLSRTFGTSISSSKTKAPGNGTLMCLRCHNGTIATDAVGGVGRERYANKQHPGISSTAHGPTDHPVGVDYPQIDRGFHPQPTVLAQGTVLLPDSKVECVSCHDPHNSSNTTHMLVASNGRSALCLTCHRK